MDDLPGENWEDLPTVVKVRTAPLVVYPEPFLVLSIIMLALAIWG